MKHTIEADKDEIEYMLNSICSIRAIEARDAVSLAVLKAYRQQLLSEAPGVQERAEALLMQMGEQVEHELTGDPVPSAPLPRVIQPNFTPLEMDTLGACWALGVAQLNNSIDLTVKAFNTVSMLMMHLGYEGQKALGNKMEALISNNAP